MGEFFQTLFNQLKEFFTKIERKKLIITGVIAVLILAVIIVSVSLLNRKTYVVLMSEMDPKDAGIVMNTLKEMGVDAKPRGSDTILVSADVADDVRLQLAAQDLPKSGYNYDAWSKASALGATDMEKRVWFQINLQENLATTISKIYGVKSCDVLVNIVEPNWINIEGNRKDSTASVQLNLRDGAKFTNDQARTVASLLITSVPNLTMNNVTVSDTTGYTYILDKEAEEAAAPDTKVEEQIELQRKVREQLQEQVLRLLNPVFGVGNVIAEVGVTLNFDTKKTESVKFDPPVPDSTEGIAISLKELEETIKGSATAAQDAAGFDPNGVAPQYPATDAANDDTVYNKVSRETNLEINETKSQIDSAKGQIEKLSVAVSLDRNLSDEDFSESVRNLVSKAVGVDLANVSVERIPFQRTDEINKVEIERQMEELRIKEAQTQQLIRWIIIAGTIIVVAVLVLIMVLSLRRKKEIAPELAAAGAEGAAFDVTVGEEYMDENGIIESRKSGVRGLIEEYIQRDPESVAHLLRNWLSSEVR